MLNQNVVMVTGASSGIGLATAKHLASHGAKVWACARSESRFATATAGWEDELKAATTFHELDVTNEDSVSACIASILETDRRLDSAFNNAGIGHHERIEDTEMDSADSVFAVNARGLLLCLKHQFRAMRPSGRGAIVNNLSVHAHRVVFPGISAYVASKHAALGLTKSAALEGAEHNIRVNGIAPGPIATEMLEASAEAIGGLDQWMRRIPQGKAGEVEDVEATVAWLLSEQSRYISGQIVGIDGGFMAST